MTNKKFSLLLALTLAFSTAFGTVQTAYANVNVPIQEITLDADKKTVTVGAVLQLNAKLEPPSASKEDLKWYSSDTRVATVTDGKVTTYRSGGTIIKAASSDGNVYATCFLSVGVPYNEWRFIEEQNGIRTDYGYYYDYYDYNGYYPYYLPTVSPYYFYDPYYYYDYRVEYTPNKYYEPYSPYVYPYNYTYIDSYNPYYYPTNSPYTVEVVRTIPTERSTVAPGTADSASALSAEFAASATTNINDDNIEFSYYIANTAINISPKTITYDGTNKLKFGSSILPRLSKFGLKNIEYNLSTLKIAINPEMEKPRGLTISATNIMPTGQMNEQWISLQKASFTKLWQIQSNSNKQGLDLTFKIDNNYSKSQLELIKWDSDNQQFQAYDANDFKIFTTTAEGETTKFLRIESVDAGTYAVILK